MKAQLKNIYPDVTLHPAQDTAEHAQNIAKFLFSSQAFTLKYLSKRLRRAIFRKRDPELLSAVQKEFQEVSLKAAQDRDEPLLAEIFIGRILALYPFLEPTGTLEVPIYKDQRWITVTYTVERWELSPPFLGSPLTGFALTAPSHPSLFLFMGTAFPTMSGHLLSLWTDFVPGLAVGELAFHLFVKKRMSKWLDKQRAPVFIYGQSLGACLALQTVCAFDDKIEQVHAYCPPALFMRSLASYEGRAKVQLYWHKNDIIPLVGRGFHPLWKMFYIRSDEPQFSFFAHTRAVPALSPLTIEEKMPPRLSWPLVTLGHFLLSLPIFCITSALLCIKMVWHFLRKR